MRLIQNGLLRHGLLWVVALTVVGCVGQNNQASDPAPGDLANGDANSSESSEFDGSLPTVEAVPPLLPATSPDQRVAQIATGRSDPFSSVSSSQTLVPAMSVQSQPSLQPLVPLQPIPLASLPNLPPPPLSTIPIPLQAPQQQPILVNPGQVPMPAAPTAPAVAVVPVIQTVQVNGVVELGGIARAIISIPNEESGLTVGVGDRIARGQVLVKRIDIGHGGDPVVVLEQDGVEVVRTVSLTGG